VLGWPYTWLMEGVKVNSLTDRPDGD